MAPFMRLTFHYAQVLTFERPTWVTLAKNELINIKKSNNNVCLVIYESFMLIISWSVSIICKGHWMLLPFLTTICSAVMMIASKLRNLRFSFSLLSCLLALTIWFQCLVRNFVPYLSMFYWFHLYVLLYPVTICRTKAGV